VNLSNLEKYLIKTLAYYDIFNYPLTAGEIYYNLRVNHTSTAEVEELLVNLAKRNLIFRKGNYYQLSDEETYIIRRERGNKLAAKRLKTARRISRLISGFPYVRAILLSGSLSKGFMEKNSDIDYFIITQPNRLWLTRALLMSFKKMFLLNSRKNFCINYFVDLENLEIQEKNIFTATEIATLIPTFGATVYDEFYNRNIWIKEYYPNFPKRVTDDILKDKPGFLKSFIEKIFNSSLGERLDDFFMHLFERHNKKRYRHYSQEDFRLAFKSNKKESKHHPLFFQKKVLLEFEKKLNKLEERLQTSLS
jgi:predicted nucleotidyltransferase